MLPVKIYEISTTKMLQFFHSTNVLGDCQILVTSSQMRRWFAANAALGRYKIEVERQSAKHCALTGNGTRWSIKLMRRGGKGGNLGQESVQ